MNKSVLGIDVSKRKLDVCLRHNSQLVIETFENSANGFRRMASWLVRQQVNELHACLEATGTYGEAVTEFLFEAGYRVSVVNPARIKAYGESQLKRNKTDKLDARLIADFCLTQNPYAWSPPDPAMRDLRTLVRQLDDSMTIRQQERNRLKSGATSAATRLILRRHIAFLDRQISQLDTLILAHIGQHPHLERIHALLMSITGIAHRTAARLMAEIQNIHTFSTKKQLAAYAGLCPRLFFSGSSVRGKPCLSKRGNPALRKTLFFPAMVARKHNPVIRAFSDRLRANGKSPASVTAAAMHKLLLIVFGVWSSGRPFDPALCLTF